MISASTVTPLTVGWPTWTPPPSSANSNGPKVTFEPAPPASFSTRRVSPSATRYCFPPDEMTAYMESGPRCERRSLEREPRLSSEQTLQDLIDGLGVSLAAGLLHDGAHEEAHQLGGRGEAGGLVGMGGDD